MARSTRPSTFLSKAESDQIVAAIKAAELKTSGEIRLHLERKCGGDPQKAAKLAFERLAMHQTAEKNGVLLYLAVADRAFAVIGDSGIDAKVEPAFWDTLRDGLAESFKRDEFGDGLAAAIGKVGERLAASFPRKADDQNELPDDISTKDDE